jgi:hypothetical protein
LNIQGVLQVKPDAGALCFISHLSGAECSPEPIIAQPPFCAPFSQGNR